MSDAIRIRPADRADLPAILAIYNEAVLTTTASYDYEPRSQEAQEAWFDDHATRNLPVLVAESDAGEILGWSTLSTFRPRPGYRFTCENSVYVAASARGRGLGKRLLAPLIEDARRLGFRSIIAVIDARNEVSLRLHENFGFERAALLRNVGYKFDRWLDIVFMQLQLRSDDQPNA